MNYIYSKWLVLVHLRRYYEYLYIIALLLFFNIFLFCLKGYSENLTGREIVRAAEEINREGQNF